ncbi:sensor histidine kinase [Acidicapsa ligni]|uniref:sensor histidine kinase n=1 Tax=Acidicapsa ligni TaxID=542300 RepID=UPI0021E02208|nr:histidine kinase [Acidicapsa ligni]
MYWALQVVGWTAVVGTLLLFYWPYVPTGARFPYFTLDMFLAFLATFPLRLLGRAAWKSEHHRISSGMLCIFVGLLFGFVTEGLSELAALFLWAPSRHITVRSLLAEGVDYAILLGCWCVFYFGCKSFLEVRRNEELLQRVQVLARESQLKALRSQIHPHFLFNALNAVSSLVVAGRSEEARMMIQRLDELLGAMLDSQEDHLTDVSTELYYAKQYLEIQRVRFDDSLSVEFDIQLGIETFRVPRWFLLPLLENAVRYGLPASDKGAPVRLSMRQRNEVLLVTIRNMLPREEDEHRESGFGIGLRNIHELLRTIYGDFASLSIERIHGVFVLAIELPKVVSSEYAGILALNKSFLAR